MPAPSIWHDPVRSSPEQMTRMSTQEPAVVFIRSGRTSCFGGQPPTCGTGIPCAAVRSAKDFPGPLAEAFVVLLQLQARTQWAYCILKMQWEAPWIPQRPPPTCVRPASYNPLHIPQVPFSSLMDGAAKHLKNIDGGTEDDTDQTACAQTRNRSGTVICLRNPILPDERKRNARQT